MTELQIETPEATAPEPFTDPRAAVDRLEALCRQATTFLCDGFDALLAGRTQPRRLRAFYPQVAITTPSFAHTHSRPTFRHLPMPGHWAGPHPRRRTDLVAGKGG